MCTRVWAMRTGVTDKAAVFGTGAGAQGIVKSSAVFTFAVADIARGADPRGILQAAASAGGGVECASILALSGAGLASEACPA